MGSYAMEQNREVLGVPRSFESLASRGCHRLIRDDVRLMKAVDEIPVALGQLSGEIRRAPDEPPVCHPAELALTDQKRSLLGQLDDRPSSVDELINRTGLLAPQVIAALSVLERERLVWRLPCHQFARV
jgi:DNA processing protein